MHLYSVMAGHVGYPECMRNNIWLERQLREVWQRYFFDVSEYNPVRIEFGRRARTRLGSIRFDPKNPEQTLIRISGWFMHPEVPADIVRSVIVHEMCHYAHGFHSGIEQQHTHPHAGGVVRKEFEHRGLGELYDRQQTWVRDEWPRFLRKHEQRNHGQKRNTTRRRKLPFLG